MRTVGIITTAVLAAAAVAGAVLAALSFPDIRRYLRIRSM
jgi:hypothetical protein